jgi:hypothetical protein
MPMVAAIQITGHAAHAVYGGWSFEDGRSRASAVKRLVKFVMFGWALWALDLDDFIVMKAQRILLYESWRECTYASIVQTRGELNNQKPTLRPGRKQPTAIFQCLPDTFTPQIGTVRPEWLPKPGP